MSSNRPRISLEVVEGPYKGKSFSFEGHDTFLVGRSPDAHLRMSSRDRHFSRIHFMIELNPPQCRLTDMGSRNGTFVNGKRVKSAELADGDCIKAGHTVLQVKLEKPIQTAEETAVFDRPLTLSPSPAIAADVSAKHCRVCFAPLEPVAGTPRFLSSPWPLCEECLGQLRKQPQTIPGYQLIRRLGKGGMGLVHLGLRINDGLVVAIKTLTPAVSGSQADYRRFQREAEILKRLQHPNIVAFHDAGEAEGLLFFVMEYVPGEDVQQLLQRDGPLPPARAVAIMSRILEALEYAHGLGFVHRDIKPANILLKQSAINSQRSAESGKLADFGLARVYQTSNLSGLTLQGDLGGTTWFMAPEQITSFREAKPAADQYSAAATLYTLLSGQPLFDMPERFNDQILKILHDEPVPLRTRRPEVPEALANVIHRALAKRPEKRFVDVKAFREALREALPASEHG